MEKENLFAKELTKKAIRSVDMMMHSYRDNDLLRNHVNYGSATAVLGVLRDLGHKARLDVWGDADFLVAAQLVIDDLEIDYDRYRKFYFTFGTAQKFPYKRGQYVIVMAKNYREATEKFKMEYPNPDGNDVLNCADYYDEKTWERYAAKYYAGKEPERVLK